MGNTGSRCSHKSSDVVVYPENAVVDFCCHQSQSPRTGYIPKDNRMPVNYDEEINGRLQTLDLMGDGVPVITFTASMRHRDFSDRSKYDSLLFTGDPSGEAWDQPAKRTSFQMPPRPTRSTIRARSSSGIFRTRQRYAHRARTRGRGDSPVAGARCDVTRTDYRSRNGQGGEGFRVIRIRHQAPPTVGQNFDRR